MKWKSTSSIVIFYETLHHRSLPGNQSLSQLLSLSNTWAASTLLHLKFSWEWQTRQKKRFYYFHPNRVDSNHIRNLLWSSCCVNISSPSRHKHWLRICYINRDLVNCTHIIKNVSWNTNLALIWDQIQSVFSHISVHSPEFSFYIKINMKIFIHVRHVHFEIWSVHDNA